MGGSLNHPSLIFLFHVRYQRRDNFPSSIFQLGLNYTIETTKPASKWENKEANKLFSKTNKSGLTAGDHHQHSLLFHLNITEFTHF